MIPTSVTHHANAKINLYLHVTGIFDNGFHILDSLVVFADVYDCINVEVQKSSKQLNFSTTGPFGHDIPADENNIVLKAANFLQNNYDCPWGAKIVLEKNLPPASGIGGGSADAAAAIRALAAIWELKLPGSDSNEFNQNLARNLGADVPVCLLGKNVFMGGIGDELTPAPSLPHCWLVLANPGVAVSTPEVFKGRTGDFSSPARFAHPPKDISGLAELLNQRSNDLFESALAIAPEIGRVIEALAKQDGANAPRMSGSGATCIAIFTHESTAKAAASKLGKQNPGWWVRAARMLG